jgi:hypothetical protein
MADSDAGVAGSAAPGFVTKTEFNRWKPLQY